MSKKDNFCCSPVPPEYQIATVADGLTGEPLLQYMIVDAGKTPCHDSLEASKPESEMITFQVEYPLRDEDNLCVGGKIIGRQDGTKCDPPEPIVVYDEIGCYFNELPAIFDERLKGRTGVAAKREDGHYRICYWT